MQTSFVNTATVKYSTVRADITKRTATKHKASEDHTFVRVTGNDIAVGVFDGMGSLPHAREAAELCAITCIECSDDNPAEMLGLANAALNRSFGVNQVGAAGAIVCVSAAGSLQVASVGDVRVFVSESDTHRRRCVTNDDSRLATTLGRNPTATEAAAQRRLANNLVRSLGETTQLTVPVVRVSQFRRVTLESDGWWGQPRLPLVQTPDDDATRLVLSLSHRLNSPDVSAQHLVVHL